jgi:integrase
LAGKGLRQKTVLNILGTLGSLMRSAKDWGYTVGSFDRERLTLPRADLARPERMFTDGETVAILNAAEGKYKAMFCLVAMSGMRCGEVLGVRWSDIDLENLVITARQQCWNGRLKIIKSRTGRRLERSMPIPTPLAEILKWYKEQWRPNRSGLALCFVSGRKAVVG